LVNGRGHLTFEFKRADVPKRRKTAQVILPECKRSGLRMIWSESSTHPMGFQPSANSGRAWRRDRRRWEFEISRFENREAKIWHPGRVHINRETRSGGLRRAATSGYYLATFRVGRAKNGEWTGAAVMGEG